MKVWQPNICFKGKFKPLVEECICPETPLPPQADGCFGQQQDMDINMYARASSHARQQCCSLGNKKKGRGRAFRGIKTKQESHKWVGMRSSFMNSVVTAYLLPFPQSEHRSCQLFFQKGKYFYFLEQGISLHIRKRKQLIF